MKGGFARADPRASEWQTWTAQWLHDFKDHGEETRLHEVVSPASPYYTVQNALMNMHKQLAAIPDFYFEVLISERSLTDRDLQRAEHVIQYALGDAIAELGQPDSVPSPVKVESVKPTVIVTAPLVNVRTGPGMSHESLKTQYPQLQAQAQQLQVENATLRQQLESVRQQYEQRLADSGDEATMKGSGDQQRLTIHFLLLEDYARALDLHGSAGQDKLLGSILVGNDNIQVFTAEDFSNPVERSAHGQHGSGIRAIGGGIHEPAAKHR